MRVGQIGREAVSIVNMEEAACAASYNTLISSDLNLAERTWSALSEEQHRRDIMVDGRLLCSVLRPRFISERRHDELARISGVLAVLLERLGGLLLRSDHLLELIGASEQEREMWEIDPGYPGFTLTSRLDSFMVGTRPQFIEYNAESPAGIAFCDILSDIFRGLPAMHEWEAAAAMRTCDARAHLMETLLWAYRTHGGTGTPTIAIVDWEDVITRRDFELCADYFRAHGIPTHIADPRKLEYRGGKLWLGGERIHLVYRRVLLDQLLEKADEAAGLLSAYRDGAVCMANSPRSKLLHKKAVLALLVDGSIDLTLSEEERKIVDTCIPWTRLVQSGETTYGDQHTDLPRFVMEQKERVALKPVDQYGGHGVVLGWESTPEEWERAVERAMREPYVVQERVQMPQGRFPVWGANGLSLEPLLVDTNPLLFRGEMGGILTRMSPGTLLNVSAGTGSAAPTFVVPEEGE